MSRPPVDQQEAHDKQLKKGINRDAIDDEIINARHAYYINVSYYYLTG